jgi:hypothetical protein
MKKIKPPALNLQLLKKETDLDNLEFQITLDLHPIGKKDRIQEINGMRQTDVEWNNIVQKA